MKKNNIFYCMVISLFFFGASVVVASTEALEPGKEASAVKAREKITETAAVEREKILAAAVVEREKILAAAAKAAEKILATAVNAGKCVEVGAFKTAKVVFHKRPTSHAEASKIAYSTEKGRAYGKQLFDQCLKKYFDIKE